MAGGAENCWTKLEESPEDIFSQVTMFAYSEIVRMDLTLSFVHFLVYIEYLPEAATFIADNI